MIVVCDHHTWAVESDTIQIELAPETILGFGTPAVSTQRESDVRTGSERSSRSVWD
jgi:hypothetical protein